MPLYVGEVYVPKGGHPSYALIVEGLSSEGYVIGRDTSARNTERDFISIQFSKKPSEFLNDYEKATPEQIEEFLAKLREEHDVVVKKIGHLERFAQSQLKLTKKGFPDIIEQHCCGPHDEDEHSKTPKRRIDAMEAGYSEAND